MNYLLRHKINFIISLKFIEMARAMYLFLAAIVALLVTTTAFEVTNPPNPDQAKKIGMKGMVLDMYTPLSVTWNVIK